jgi:hypothetical protein
MFEDGRASKGDVRQLLSNAEESEAAARNYCEGFTARFRVCDLTERQCVLEVSETRRGEMRQVSA